MACNYNITEVAEDGRGRIDQRFFSDGRPHYVRPCPSATLKRQLENAKPPRKWPKAFREFHEKYPNTSFYGASASPTQKTRTSKAFVIACFLADHPQYAYSREQLKAIEKALLPNAKESGDIIQAINKTNQQGLARFSYRYKGVQLYALPIIAYDGGKIQTRTKVKCNQRQLASKKTQAQERWSAYGQESFEQGHRDPRLPLTDDNSTYQPRSINQGYKDKYLFDENGLPERHNPMYLNSHPAVVKGWSQADKDDYMLVLFRDCGIEHARKLLDSYADCSSSGR